jgi:pimeloyl-ACP methyl ester carboxylesterase
MPTARRNGAEIYYEVRGEGAPLVLVEGLGYGLWMWRGQSPAFERKFRLVLVDNRGVGRSTPLPGPYSADEFARDVLAVLDAERVEQVTVLGVSMGGAIAQSLAALAPDRVSALVLVCTTPGGPEAKPMPPETFQEVTRPVPGESAEARLRRTMAIALTPAYPREHGPELDAIIAERLASPTDPAQWMFQALSMATFDARASDARLALPTLITTGDEDRVLPWTNSLLLLKLIPRSSLAVFRGQNHLHLIERAPEFNQVVTRFLDGVAGGATEVRVEEVV